MAIETFHTESGSNNGIPDKWNDRQAKHFFQSDTTLSDLADTTTQLASGYDCEIGELNNSKDYLLALKWYEEEMQRDPHLNHTVLIKILKHALERARDIENPHNGGEQV